MLDGHHRRAAQSDFAPETSERSFFGARSNRFLPGRLQDTALLLRNITLQNQIRILKQALAARQGHSGKSQEQPEPSRPIAAVALPKLPSQGSSSRSRGADGPALGLTPRQHQVLALVLSGCPSKNIAADLGISRRTVESHRAAIMQRTGATSIPALVRLAIGSAHPGDVSPGWVCPCVNLHAKLTP